MPYIWKDDAQKVTFTIMLAPNVAYSSSPPYKYYVSIKLRVYENKNICHIWSQLKQDKLATLQVIDAFIFTTTTLYQN